MFYFREDHNWKSFPKPLSGPGSTGTREGETQPPWDGFVTSGRDTVLERGDRASPTPTPSPCFSRAAVTTVNTYFLPKQRSLGWLQYSNFKMNPKRAIHEPLHSAAEARFPLAFGSLLFSQRPPGGRGRRPSVCSPPDQPLGTCPWATPGLEKLERHSGTKEPQNNCTKGKKPAVLCLHQSTKGDPPTPCHRVPSAERDSQ